jgi:nucleotide-binding universal stress UspA family protein
MKKFIAAFDGLSFRESTMDYAIYLARHTDAHLVGVFLEDFTRRSYGPMEIANYAGEEVDRRMQDLDESDRESRRESIAQFQAACKTSGIRFSVHRDKNVAMQELLQESIYADLLIINATDSMTRYHEPAPTRFIRELLNDVQCPVVLVPDTYHVVNNIIFLYDGAPSSVHAIRTFSYLFGDLEGMATEVVTVKKEEESILLPDSRLIQEFILQHFPEVAVVVLKGDAEVELPAYLKTTKTHPMIVMGAYQRNKLSRLFKPSMADNLVRQVEAPLFIAHQKS